MNTQRVKRKLRACFDMFIGNSKYSYSQFSEDILIDFLFTRLNIEHPSYLDIGANDPRRGSNTYLFYSKKCFGVCVEPDVSLYNVLKKERPKDVVLNAGIGISDLKEATFYYFPKNYTAWNTFSEKDAEEKKAQTGIAYKNDKIIPLININELIQQHYKSAPDFISIDVEGLELDILKSLNFEKNAPKLFCLETMLFDKNSLGVKNKELINYVIEKGYSVYADTYANTLFVKNEYLNPTS